MVFSSYRCFPYGYYSTPVDELHETATLSEEVWEQLATGWSIAQILEVIIIVGWYHLISFVANAARVEQEPWAARFPQTRKGEK